MGHSGKRQKRQKQGEEGRNPISRKGGQTPLKPPSVTPPFAAAQPNLETKVDVSKVDVKGVLNIPKKGKGTET